MQLVIKGTETIAEYNYKKQHLQELVELAYRIHKNDGEEWEKGEPVGARFFSHNEILVTYENGEVWYYRDIDLPFPTYGMVDLADM